MLATAFAYSTAYWMKGGASLVQKYANLIIVADEGWLGKVAIELY